MFLQWYELFGICVLSGLVSGGIVALCMSTEIRKIWRALENKASRQRTYR